jgi:hypothetical protein
MTIKDIRPYSGFSSDHISLSPFKNIRPKILTCLETVRKSWIDSVKVMTNVTVERRVSQCYSGHANPESFRLGTSENLILSFTLLLPGSNSISQKMTYSTRVGKKSRN